MPNAMSKVADEEQYVLLGQQSSVMNLPIQQLSILGGEERERDLLRRLPAEIRVMIWEELLTVKPKTVFGGASDFGPLAKREVEAEGKVPWQILLTCRLYYNEAHPIMYTRNNFVFCTGKGGSPGMFMRFPIKTPYMQYLTNVSIYFQATNPKSESSKRIGHFLKALARNATSLEYLTVMVAKGPFIDDVFSWHILAADHPVIAQIMIMIEQRKFKNMKIRLHEGALFRPQLACYMMQQFLENGPTEGRSLVFSRSCTCPRFIQPPHFCRVCGWGWPLAGLPEVDYAVHPVHVEADQMALMDYEADIYEGGLDKDDSPSDDGDEDNREYLQAGPYKVPLYDVCEENRLAFSSAPSQKSRYRGELKAPKVYRQSELTFKTVTYDQYLEASFGQAQSFRAFANFSRPLPKQICRSGGTPRAPNVSFRQPLLTDFYMIKDQYLKAADGLALQRARAFASRFRSKPKAPFQTKLESFFRPIEYEYVHYLRRDRGIEYEQEFDYNQYFQAPIHPIV